MSKDGGGLKNLAVLFVLCFILYLWIRKSCPDAENIGAYIREDWCISILCSLAIIALKCFVVMPTTVCFIIFGYLLPTAVAFLMCLLCVAVLFTASYYRGKKSDGAKVGGILIKKDKAGVFLTALSLNCLRFFGLGVTGSLFGKVGAPYTAALLGTILGILPTIALSLSLTGFLPIA